MLRQNEPRRREALQRRVVAGHLDRSLVEPGAHQGRREQRGVIEPFGQVEGLSHEYLRACEITALHGIRPERQEDLHAKHRIVSGVSQCLLRERLRPLEVRLAEEGQQQRLRTSASSDRAGQQLVEHGLRPRHLARIRQIGGDRQGALLELDDTAPAAQAASSAAVASSIAASTSAGVGRSDAATAASSSRT